MSLTLINTFLSIVETGSLVKASKHLNITQSTVTSRLKTLEDQIGQTLLHRKKSGMVLTSAGLKFKQYAEAISHMWEQAILETSLPAGMDSICNLGCDTDLWPSLGRIVTKNIRKHHPTTALNIRQGNRKQIDELLSTGLIDVALSYRTTNLEGITAHSLNAETLALYSSIKDGPIQYDPNYIYIHAGADFGKQHATAYSEADVAKNNIDSMLWGLEHLLDYGGSAYLPTKLAEQHVKNKSLFLLKDAPVFKRNVYLLTNNSALKALAWLPELVFELNAEKSPKTRGVSF